MPTVLRKIARLLLRPAAGLADALGNHFYWLVALVLSVAAAGMILTGRTDHMKVGAYDLIMKHRFRAPPADPDIVIVDIDEPALAAMAPDHGRFPWPRSVMAEMLEGISAQAPRAIVFDITFSDPDVYHADADAWFSEVIARTPNVFLSMIRLNPANDSLSQLKVSALASATRTPAAQADATLAAVVPFFLAGTPAVSVGTNNLYADADGTTRSYHVYRDEHGWRVPSLPALIAERLGAALPDKTDVLLNFRGAPPSYARVSFHEVYFDLQREHRQRPPNEFAGKIVIIGSTAPSLFDIKPTPVAVLHPGVEILATALDNFRNGDFVVELPPGFYVSVTVAALLLLAWAFSVGVEARVVNYAFTALQSCFLAVSYLALSYSPVFVDLTAPFAFCLAFFSLAKLHGLLVTWRRAGHPLTAGASGSQLDLVVMHAVMADRRSRDVLRRLVADSQSGFPAWPLFRSWPVLDGGFRHAVMGCWRADARDAAGVAAEVATIVRGAEDRGAAGHVTLHVARAMSDRAAGEEIMRAVGCALAGGAIGEGDSVATMRVHESESWRLWTKNHS